VIGPAPLGILLMPDGVDPAGVLVGRLHNEAFRLQRDGSILPIFGASCSVCYFAAAKAQPGIEAGT